MTSAGERPVRENTVTQIWIQQLLRRDRLFTVDGRSVKVIDPGRQSGDCGPDVCDAVVSFNGRKPIRGDIEIHVWSSEWKAHEHHRNPNFNRVMLHVVLWHRGSPSSPTESGGEVPILPLSKYLMKPLERLRLQMEVAASVEQLCRGTVHRQGRAAVLRALEAAGKQRFHLQAKRLQSSLAIHQSDQVLYEGLMKALGYSKNETPFTRLARLLPVGELQPLAIGGQVGVIQALAMGTAGLLPVSKGRRGYTDAFSTMDVIEISRLMDHWQASGMSKVMSRSEWRFFRVRPDNLPPRRIAGISHLLVRHSGGLSLNMLNLAARPSLREAKKKLAESLIVRTTDYWSHHGDFGLNSGSRGALIGHTRAQDITVNIVLPFLFAYGRIHSQPRLCRRAMDIYRSHENLQENWVTRHMTRKILGGSGPGVSSACQQQGLIHIHREFCAGHKCSICPLG